MKTWEPSQNTLNLISSEAVQPSAVVTVAVYLMLSLAVATGSGQSAQLKFVVGVQIHLLTGPFVIVDLIICLLPVDKTLSGPSSSRGFFLTVIVVELVASVLQPNVFDNSAV
jgi:hypothetical protein